ncbi:MAG: carbamoyl-phosphate synthase large subunit [Vampirovibrio sp.]
MPKRSDLQRILIIGAGPIVIGQACEFDYSGTQACRALMEEGYDVILVNSNPATIMTDPDLATRTYIEPLTPAVLTTIIEKERPDALLPTMGGQTALNLAYDLHHQGVLKRFNVELIGANFEAIDVAEDRERFKQLMTSIGLNSFKSHTVTSLSEAMHAAQDLGFPLIVRPAFTLGGSGGSVVYHEREFQAKVEYGLHLSPIQQVLLEESALGWKEYEFEVMRDHADNVVIVCSVENVDPMGVHTGDSITVAPAQTLTDKEYQALRNASMQIIRAVGVEAGGCNIQFAIHPSTGRIVIIEMNPRVSRSSALVSKATGVPIAKISARLAVGYTLDEIRNDITRSTPASFEPAIDYVVTKIPRFSFDKFPEGGNQLSPQMKSVGEVMAIGRTFKESFKKALRSLEIKPLSFDLSQGFVSKASLEQQLKTATADRVYWLLQAFRQGVPLDNIHAWTKIDPWFLSNIEALLKDELQISALASEGDFPAEMWRHFKQDGLGDEELAALLKLSEQELRNKREAKGIFPVYKSVDTCAGEFEAQTPYFYSTYDEGENEAPQGNGLAAENKRVVILGGGPNRIGQGIEFDYCCVHAALALRRLGYEPIMVNSNPETVSTDYDMSDRLYFEPLTAEDVHNVLRQEQPMGVIAQLGGQTPLKLARALKEDPYFTPLGTSVQAIDEAEDREKFRTILERLGLKAPESGIARNPEEAVRVARRMGYPLMVRPSYVLGGRAMRIVYSEERLLHYLDEILAVEPDSPILIDRFLENAQELDVDALSDGETCYVAAILEHIEQAGIHSGDSACVWPAQHLSPSMAIQIQEATENLAKALNVKGLLNIQFAVKDQTLYIIEVNPRASRTVPFVAKCTGIPLIQMAVRVMLGHSLATVIQEDLPRRLPQHVAVKAPVFPFIKFRESDPMLGPEMRSTGEVMGMDKCFPLAYAKALEGAGVKLPLSGQVFLSVHNHDKPYAIEVAKRFKDLGFTIISTQGTARFLSEQGIDCIAIHKRHEGAPNAQTLIESGDIQLVINTPSGDEGLLDDSYIRKSAVIHNTPMTTTLTGAIAMAEAIEALKSKSYHIQALQHVFA